MVLPLGPGKFYGSSLPRPRIYTDVKFSDERVDPPVSVSDPLLSWANEAHWSMGGLCLKRLRLQGRIEGNVHKLRKEQEKILKNKPQISTPIFKSSKGKSTVGGRKGSRKRSDSDLDSPPPPPLSRKLRLRSRVVALGGEDEAEDKEQIGGVMRKRRRLVRKLGDDFEMVANENGNSSNRRSPLKDVSNARVLKRDVSSRTRGRRTMVLNEDEEESDDNDGAVLPKEMRSSPRLKKQTS